MTVERFALACFPALRARCDGESHWEMRSSVVEMGESGVTRVELKKGLLFLHIFNIVSFQRKIQG